MELSITRLKSAQAAVNDSDAFRALGSVDARVVFASGKSAFLVTFRAFRCADVQRIDAAEVRDGDFTIEMTPGDWRDYLAQRHAGDETSLAELDLDRGIVKAADPRRKQDFFRYHQSLQLFIDALADVAPTSRRAARASY